MHLDEDSSISSDEVSQKQELHIPLKTQLRDQKKPDAMFALKGLQSLTQLS